MKLIALVLALVAANFIYQAFTGQQWGVAIERSWFQMVAIAIAWMAGAVST